MKNIALFIFTLLFSASLYANCNAAKSYTDQATVDKKNKNYQQALNNLQQAILLCPGFDVYFKQGKTLVKLDRLDEALDSYDKAGQFIEEGSGDKINLLASIAIVHLKKGSLQTASIYVDQSYDIERQNSPASILKLRKYIALKNAEHVATAEEIKQTLKASRSFGAVPVVKFNSITFKFNSTELTPQGHQQVVELSKVLAGSLKGNQQALLIGHTDQLGDAAYNLTLSKQRADAVKKLLLSMNPDFKGLLRTAGKGETELKYLGNSEEDHQLNRRVEMQLL